MEKRKHIRRDADRKDNIQRKNPNVLIIGLLGTIVFFAATSLAFDLGRNIRENKVEEARMVQVSEAATAQAMYPVSLNDDILGRIIRIWSLTEEEKNTEGSFSYGSCTGLITNSQQTNQFDTDYVETKILTAKHCVHDNDASVTVAMPDGEVFSGSIYDVQPLSPNLEDDASIIVTITSLPLVWESLESIANNQVTLTMQTPAQGENITVCGYPSVVQSYETYATIFCRQATVTGTEDGFITTTLPISGGDSGGPWINSAGEVFGVTRGGNALDEANLTGYGLPIKP